MDYAEVQLYDAYLDTYTDLSSGVNTVSFSVDSSIPASVAVDRFQLVFDTVTLGSDAYEESSLQVYPNPVINNQLQIKGLSDFSSDSHVQLHLYDIFGREIHQQSIKTFNRDQKIKFPELSNGSYILELTSGQQYHQIHLLIK